MTVGDVFKVSNDYISNLLQDYSFGLVNLINCATETNLVEIQTLKFISSKEFLVDSVTLKIAVECGIPIIDYMIYQNLSKENKAKVTWKVDKNRRKYTETEINFSVLFIYFMLMTRNKVTIEKNEKIPNFLLKFMKTPMIIDEISDCLSTNNLSLFNHQWIKSIKISKLNSSLKNRFKQGIAGMRLFSAIANNKPNKEISSSMEYLVSNIRDLVKRGPYWEMHSMFQSERLASESINSNLNNLLLELYDDVKLNDMLKNRVIFKYPIKNERTLNYLSWNTSFFDEFKTPIIID